MSLSSFRLLVTPWAAAYQAPLTMGFARQEYWSGVPLPSLNFSLFKKINIRHLKCRIFNVIEIILEKRSYIGQ